MLHSWIEAWLRSTDQVPPGRRDLLPSTIVNRARDFTLQLRAGNDPIDKTVLDQKLAGLKALGQLDPNRRLDRPRAGKANQSLGFGKDDVPQRSKAGRDASHRRIGQHGDKQSARLIVA